MPLIIYMQYGGHFYQSPKGVFFFVLLFLSHPSNVSLFLYIFSFYSVLINSSTCGVISN